MPPPRTPRPSAGGFPQTPAPAPRLSAGKGPLPNAPEANPSQLGSTPRIPLTLIDAPTQRFWAFAVYGALWGWKLYDWVNVVENQDTSPGLMIKWCAIDCLYIFLLPEMRIPWLELSTVVATVVYSIHFFVNFLLMFNVPVCKACHIFWRPCALTCLDSVHGPLPGYSQGLLLRQGDGNLGA